MTESVGIGAGGASPASSKISSQEDMNALNQQINLTHRENTPTLKYINKTRTQVQKENFISGMMSTSVKASAFLAGAGACALLVGKLALTASAFATMATPLGIAIGGVVLLAAGVMTARHIYMKSHQRETDTLNLAGSSVAWACGAFLTALVIAAFALTIASGDGSLFALGWLFGRASNRVDVLEWGLESDGPSRENQTLNIYQGDTVKVYTQRDGQVGIEITPPPS